MIRRLQRKFICIVMLSLGLVILLLLGSINLLKYHNTAKRADEMLRYLSDNNGRFPDSKRPPGKREMTTKPAGMNEDTGFKTRFFVVCWMNMAMPSASTPDVSLQFLLKRRYPMDSALPEGNIRGYQGPLPLPCIDPGFRKYGHLPGLQHRAEQRPFFSAALLRHWRSCLCCRLLYCGFVFAAGHPPHRRGDGKAAAILEDASHELKTPLAIISANNDVLELTVGTSQWSDSIRNQVSRMDGLLQSMLALTKLDAQRPELHMELLDFSSLISQAAESFDVLANANQVSLSLQVAPAHLSQAMQTACGSWFPF